MSFKDFLKHYRRLAKKGWRRADDNIRISLKRPGVKRKTYNNFSFSPLTAVYFDLTGRRVGWAEAGTLSIGLKMSWNTVRTIEDVSAYPNGRFPSDMYWKCGLKERLMRMIPVA